jgi:hypothetical protein
LSTGPQDDFPAEASIPRVAASLESILRTEESRQGPSRPSYRACILSAALAALLSVGAWSQTQLATVFGAVTDPSGAVVPGVSVTIVSQGTGLKRSVALRLLREGSAQFLYLIAHRRESAVAAGLSISRALSERESSRLLSSSQLNA